MIIELLRSEDATEKLSTLGYRDPEAALRNLTELAKGVFAGTLDAASDAALASPSPTQALVNLIRISESVEARSIEELLALGKLGRLATLCGSSELLVNTICRRPNYFDWLFLEGGMKLEKDVTVFTSELLEMIRGQ